MKPSHRIRLLVVLALGVVLVLPSVAGAITRETVLRRGEAWIEKKVPYSQSGYATTAGYVAPASATTWRRDCSGFVSMCLDLRRSDGSAMSLDTAWLPTKLTAITGTSSQKKAKLKPGDLIVRPKDLVIDGKRVPYGHAVVFVRWVDEAKTRYVGYHESSGRGSAVAQEITYPFYNEKGFSPYRYPKIEDGRLRKSRTWIGPYSPPLTDLTIFDIGIASPSYVTPIMSPLVFPSDAEASQPATP